MPDDPFITGEVQVGIYEGLVHEHMPPPGEAYVYEEPERQPEPTADEVAAVMGRPVPRQDDLTLKQSIQAAIGADTAKADRERRGEA